MTVIPIPAFLGPPTKIQSIYVISGYNGWLKIGRAADPAHRLKMIQYKLRKKEPKVLLAVEYVSEELPAAWYTEPVVHRHLSEYRKEGEWFSITLVQAINAIEWAIQEPLCRGRFFPWQLELAALNSLQVGP